ncbi:MAG: PilN domain-containing protein [Methylophilaceae bacterium]|nr:PilN domain-containing protein [Methylophilaceae bacterium]
MSQQINLVNPALRPKRELLTASHMAGITAGMVVLLCAYGGYLSFQASTLAAQRAAWARQLQEVQASLVQSIQQNPARQPNPALENEIAEAERQLRQREQVLDFLKSGAIGTSQGFSGLMHAFAHVQVPGVWLTGFGANGKGDEMHIQGRALSPELIPQYIAELSTEAVLRGRSFSGLRVSQPLTQAAVAGDGQQKITQPSFVEFSLSAGQPPQEQPAAPGTKS